MKIHTLLDLRGNIPSFILITDGKYHDSNVLDILPPIPDAVHIMDRAYIDFKALYQMHKSGAFFISRSKSSMDYMILETNYNIDENTGLRSDKIIELKGYKSKQLYPESLRLVEFYDIEKDNKLSFLTNNFDITALEVANLYRNRWQIEIFFKWIKQNLTLKNLWGHSENEVNIHIWVAICTYFKHALRSELSIYEILQILSISVFDKTNLQDLLTEYNTNQNVKEQRNLFSD